MTTRDSAKMRANFAGSPTAGSGLSAPLNPGGRSHSDRLRELSEYLGRTGQRRASALRRDVIEKGELYALTFRSKTSPIDVTNPRSTTRHPAGRADHPRSCRRRHDQRS